MPGWKQLYWVPPGALSEGLSGRACHHAVPSWQGLGALGSRAMADPASAAQEAQHSGTFPHLTVANCWKMLWVLMENIHWMWLCVASKKDSWELQLPESHISCVTCSSHKSCEHCWNSGHHYLILTRDALYDGLFSLTDLHGSGNKKETESFLIRED